MVIGVGMEELPPFGGEGGKLLYHNNVLPEAAVAVKGTEVAFKQ